MSASKLVKPAIEFKQSYLEALEEFHAEGRYEFIKLDDIKANFPAFVEDLNGGRRHLHKPFSDWAEPVPETALWMVKDREFIGSFIIRHRLNWHLEKWGGHVSFVIRPSMRGKGFGNKLLQKGMPFVSYLGIDRALITVDPKNTPAIKVIEFCGGQYQDETPKTEQFPARKRFWLDCS